MDHVQVGVGDSVLRRGRWDSLDAGILCVDLGFGGLGG